MGLLQGLVVARALGPDMFGVYALALTFCAFIFLILDPRSGDAVVRYLAEFRTAGEVPRSRAVIRAGLLLDAAWGAAGLVLVSVLSSVAARVLHIEGHTGLIPVVALGLSVAAPVATSRAVLSVFERFDAIARRQFVVALLRATSVCAVALGGLGLTGVIWTLTIVSVLECGLFVSGAVGVASAHLGGRGIMRSPLSPLRGRGREMTHFLAFSGLTTLASSAIKQADTLLVGAIAGPREAGYYRLAKSLTAPAGNVGGPVQTVLLPRLATAESEGDAVRADAIVRQTFRRLSLPFAVLVLLGLPLVSPAVRLLAGEAYRGAVGPTIALAVGVSVSFVALHLRPMFLVRHQMRALLVFTTLLAVCSIASFVPMAAAFGAGGVAWARTFVVAVGSAVMAIYLRRTVVAQRSRRPPSPFRGTILKEPL